MKDIGSDKVSGFSCCAAMRNCQKSPHRLKPKIEIPYLEIENRA
jgi:hypothetical protein